MNRAKLQAKVDAVNKAGSVGKLLHPILVKYFRDWVGEKILKVDGDLLAKIDLKVRELMEDPLLKGMGIRFYHNRSAYSLSWTVNVCEHVQGGTSCTYHEVTVYIGELDGAVLKSVNDAGPTFNCYHTVDAVIAARLAVEKAEKALSEAKGKLYPFEMHDNN